MPARAFEPVRWISPKVAPDCHVVVDKVLYSVPFAHVGKSTDTRGSDTTVAVHVDGKLVKTWPKATRGRCTDPGDYPPEKIAFFARNPVWCRRRAAELGPSVAELVETLLALHALHHLRAAQGVIALAERHSPARLEAACARALQVGDPTYRTVRGILAAGTETAGTETAGTETAGTETAGTETAGTVTSPQDPTQADNGSARPGGASVATPAHLHGPTGLLAHLHPPGHNPDDNPADNSGEAGDGVSAVAR